MKKIIVPPFFKKFGYPIFAPIFLLLLVTLCRDSHFLLRWENETVDMRFKLRAAYDKRGHTDLILVGIDEDSIRKYGAWPWTRDKHGYLCSLLAPMEPSVLCFDLLFTEPKDQKYDDFFAQHAAELPFCITGAKGPDNKDHAKEPDLEQKKADNLQIGKTRPITQIKGDMSKLNFAEYAFFPIPQLRESAYFGFVDANPSEVDGIRRQIPLLVRIGDKVFPGLSLQILMGYWNVQPEQVKVHIGKYIEIPSPDGIRRIPINSRAEFNINYRKRETTFFNFAYNRLMTQLVYHVAQGKPWDTTYPQLKGKILIVGQVASGLTDLSPDPIDSRGILVAVHLNTINNILLDDYLYIIPGSFAPVAAIWLVLAWLTLWLLADKRISQAVGIPIFIIVAYIGSAFGLFYWKSWQLPIFWPVVSFFMLHIGSGTLRWIEEQKSKQAIKGVFATYLSPGVMNRLLSSPDHIQLGGERKPVTILFSDIRGFTTISEGAGEVELVRQLNEYFTQMVDCVNKTQGTLHKYIGDAVMAVWGDVFSEGVEKDARGAVRAAVNMRRELVKLNQFWKSDNRMELKIGIGLNHGHVLVGNIGAPQRQEFTVIGDAVNLASRLEGVTKPFHTDLIVSETVHALLGNEFLTRSLGLIVVKGKTKPVRIFEVLDDLLNPDNSCPPAWAHTYEEGFESFLKKDFAKAIARFESCLEQRPGDFCSQQYLDASTSFMKTPPPPDWTGVHVMETK